MAIYLAIDLGTTGCRSILFDETLRQLGAAYEEYGLITPKETWVEQDARLWWDMTLRTAKKAIEGAGIDPKTVDGISVSSQGITIVPVDEQLEPLCNAQSWLDNRGVAQAVRLEADWGREWMFAHTGKPIDPCYTLPKLLWLQENEPELYNRAWKFLMPMEYLIGKFTGNCVTDHSMASGTLMYDIANCCWSRDVLERYGIPEEKLPALCWSGELAGVVLPEVAQELGLREDCVVAVGAQDQKCASLGAGLKDGVMTVSLGTAAAIIKQWNRPLTREHTKVAWCGNVDAGTWVTEGVINTAGTCLRWVRDLMFPGESYDQINREAEAARESGSSLLFHPYLSGPSAPDYYPQAQGNFYGVTLATGRGHFALAVMEGVAFQLRVLLEAMDAYGSVEKLIFFGGGANSDLWCQIISDITGMEIAVTANPEAAGAGAAMLAARAAGKELPALEYARSYKPQRDYEEKYRAFRAVERRLWKEETL